MQASAQVKRTGRCYSALWEETLRVNSSSTAWVEFFLFSGAGRKIIFCDFNLNNGNPVCLLSPLVSVLIFLKCKSQFLNINILVSKGKIVMERKWNVRGAVSPFLIILSISKNKIAWFGLPQINAAGFLGSEMNKPGFSWSLIWNI